jgi:molybdopterin-guanine dinucleotide biosynthesis protein A
LIAVGRFWLIAKSDGYPGFRVAIGRLRRSIKSLTRRFPFPTIRAMQIPHIDSKPLYPDVTGVILAGGRSVRMGRDKACLEVDGTTFFARIADLLRGLFPQVLIAGERPDLAVADLPYVADLYPGSALGGLYTGLTTADTPFIFVAPCDIPFPDAGLIRALVDRRAGFDVVVPRTAAGLEPLFAVYGKGCLAAMRSMLERGHYRVYDLFPQLHVCELSRRELPAGWERALRNVNTPEEYRRIKEEP